MAAANELTADDDINSRMNGLDITQRDGKNATGTTAETASPDTEPDERLSCGRNHDIDPQVRCGIDGVRESPTNSDSAEFHEPQLVVDNGATDVQHVEDYFFTQRRNEYEDNAKVEKEVEEDVSDIGNCLSALKLESSASAVSVADLRHQHISAGLMEAASESSDDLTADDANSEHHCDGAEANSEKKCIADSNCMPVSTLETLPVADPVTECVNEHGDGGLVEAASESISDVTNGVISCKDLPDSKDEDEEKISALCDCTCLKPPGVPSYHHCNHQTS